VASPWEVSRKARRTGCWWKSRQQRLEERASVQRHFALWRQAATESGARRLRVSPQTGEPEYYRLKLTWKEFTDHVQKHEASWMGQATLPTVRIGARLYRLAA
jgi:hypothetical protein